MDKQNAWINTAKVGPIKWVSPPVSLSLSLWLAGLHLWLEWVQKSIKSIPLSASWQATRSEPTDRCPLVRSSVHHRPVKCSKVTAISSCRGHRQMDGLTERVRQEEGQTLALALLLLLLLLHVKQCQQFNTVKRPRNFSNSLDNEKRDEVTLNQSPLWRQLSTACGRVDRVSNCE